jgi:hypothetical protein
MKVVFIRCHAYFAFETTEQIKIKFVIRKRPVGKISTEGMMIILKWIVVKVSGMVLTRFIWLWIAIDGVLLMR